MSASAERDYAVWHAGDPADRDENHLHDHRSDCLQEVRVVKPRSPSSEPFAGQLYCCIRADVVREGSAFGLTQRQQLLSSRADIVREGSAFVALYPHTCLHLHLSVPLHYVMVSAANPSLHFPYRRHTRRKLVRHTNCTLQAGSDETLKPRP